MGSDKFTLEDFEGRIEHKKLYWQHDRLSQYNSPVYIFDKDVQRKIKIMLKRVKPEHGVMSAIDKTAFGIATRHARDKVILKLDVKDYYGNMKFFMIDKILKREFSKKEIEFIEKFYFDEDGLRRGLFASPIISELIGVKFDNLVGRILFEHGWKNIVKYSRYYDDLIFSADSINVLRELERELTKEISKMGFEFNPKKSKILWSTSAKILGLRIHNGKVVTPKKFRNKFRVRARYADDIVYRAFMYEYDSVKSIEKAMVAVGTVIGSLEFILKNSDEPSRKYRLMMEYYCRIFSKLKNLENGKTIGKGPLIENDIDILKIKAEALDLIYKERHPWRNVTEKEMIETKEMLRMLPVVSDDFRV